MCLKKIRTLININITMNLFFNVCLIGTCTALTTFLHNWIYLPIFATCVPLKAFKVGKKVTDGNKYKHFKSFFKSFKSHFKLFKSYSSVSNIASIVVFRTLGNNGLLTQDMSQTDIHVKCLNSKWHPCAHLSAVWLLYDPTTARPLLEHRLKWNESVILSVR